MDAGSVVDVIVNSENHSSLEAFVTEAGLVDALNEGQFIVFAPVNRAFVTALVDLELSTNELLADTELLTSLLTYHVVDVSQEQLGAGELRTVNGATVEITTEDGELLVNGVPVIAAVEADNGVVYVIESVLVPPSDAAESMDEAEATPEAEATEED